MDSARPRVAPDTAAAPAMAVGGVVGLEGGATIARLLFGLAGVPGTVALRLGFGALLLAVRRPPRWPVDRRDLLLTGTVGVLLVVHHLAFYAAVDRLPLGVAVTLEFCGPLIVALAGSRRALHLGWAGLAGAGVVLCSGAALHGRWHAAGVVLALLAGGCWAGYIMLFPRVRAGDDRGRALSGVTLVAAVIALPYGIAVDHAGMFTWRALGLGLAIALLADVIAFTLQAHALGRMSARAFSVVTSTEPAVGALFGLLALGQRIDALQWAGLAAVCAAAAATALERGRATPDGRGARSSRG